MSTQYHYARSPQLRALRLSWFARAFYRSAVPRETIDETLSFSERMTVVSHVEESIIPHIQKILGADGLCEGVDLVRLDMSAFVFGRVRMFRITRFVRAAKNWLTQAAPDAVTVWPSFHYTDWLLVRSLRVAKIRLGLLSRFSATMARAFLSVSDRRIYAPRSFTASPSVPTTVPGLLFVATMETHAKNLLPLMLAARKQGIAVGLITASGARHWKCLAKIPDGVQLFNFRDFITAADIEEYQKDCATYARLYSEHTAALKTIARLEGVDFWPIVAAGLKDFYETTLPANRLYIRVARRILASGPTSIVNSRLLRASETALAALARNSGVRVTTILHGLITDEPDFYYASGRFDLSDRVYVWNDAQKKHVERKRGHVPGDVIVDANPQWEHLSGMKADRAAVLSQLGVSGVFKRIITFCAQPANDASLWRMIADAASKNTDTLCILKTHPTVPKERVLAGVGTLSANVLVVDDTSISLYPLLMVSDLLITVTSTTLFEALVIGTPVCLFRAHSFSFVDELRGYGMPVLENAAELQALFVSHKTKDAYWAACEKFRRNYMGVSRDVYEGISNRILSFVTSRS